MIDYLVRIVRKVLFADKNQTTIMISKIILPTMLIGLSFAILHAQSIAVPFDSEQWTLENAKTSLEQYQGRSSIKLSGGAIYLPEVKFLNGTIEVDVNFPAQRNFFGLIFRGQDDTNHEHFYLRPHQSGNPDACQYTPVFNGVSGWQLYHGEGFGAPIDLQPDRWHHLKIVIQGNQATVFYDDMESPALKISEMKGNFPAGHIGLNSGQAVHFANFTYQPDETSYPGPVSQPTADPAVVTNWQLSGAQANALFQNLTVIDKSFGKKIKWRDCPTESSGLLNIARYVQAKKDQTTAIAKLRIRTEKDELKGLAFGYSDEVMVFVNGKLQYAGQNNYTSRDYRYLGTIGYFDAVFLDLKKGENEVWFVVKENFGGWGLQAKWMK